MLLYRLREDSEGSGQGWLIAEVPGNLASDVTFEAAADLGFGFALGGAPAAIGQCRPVATHADGDHPIKGGIYLAVAAAVETVPVSLAA